MSARWFVLCLLVLAGCGGSQAPPRRAATPAGGSIATGCHPEGGVQECVFSVKREPRRYLRVGPAERGPVIVALHGVGGAGADPETTRRVSGLDRLAGRAEIVYADGEGDWDDDDAYFAALFDELGRRPTYVIGWSGGGFMAHRIACRFADRVTAVAALNAPLRGPCRPSRPVSVLQIAGTEDPLIPFGGGTTPDGEPSPPVAKATARWRALDGCGAPRGVRAGRVTTTAATCRGGTAVRLIALEGAGHNWYGPQQPPPDNVLDATEAAWRFFASLRSGHEPRSAAHLRRGGARGNVRGSG